MFVTGNPRDDVRRMNGRERVLNVKEVQESKFKFFHLDFEKFCFDKVKISADSNRALNALQQSKGNFAKFHVESYTCTHLFSNKVYLVLLTKGCSHQVSLTNCPYILRNQSSK